ncbi:MAG: hypothetical protein JKY04_03240 [Sneathiella sp.]|nr:hypothetical protein [Sneathiella sp.]
MSSEYYQLEEEDGSVDLSQILGIVKRRIFYFFILLVLGLILTVAVVYLIPPRYESAGTVLVEAQQIPVELVQSTVTSKPNQRITVIKQRVLTRRNLLKIIDKYNVFKEDRKKLSASQLVEEMQNLIRIDIIRSDERVRRMAVTIAFKVSFQHENPETAAKVANELVTLFLSENVKTRTARASETTEFLQQEASKLGVTLTLAENAISEFKRENSDSLPEHLNLRLNILERTQTEIKTLETQVSSLREERKYLDLELAGARANIQRPFRQKDIAQNTTELDLEQTKDLLTKLLSQFTPKHPDVKSLQRRVKAMEKQIAEDHAQSSQEAVDAKDSSVLHSEIRNLIQRLQIRITSNQRSISIALKQLTILRQKASDTESRIVKIPEVERGLSVLNRTHREILVKYQELESKQGKAKLAQNLEEEKKAERFLLIEPPIVPTEPVWPDRFKFIAIGAFLSFASGIGAGILMELVDRRIRTAKELETLLKHPPLVSIPYIKTRRDIQKKTIQVSRTSFCARSVWRRGRVKHSFSV